MGELVQLATGGPWYVSLAAGLFLTMLAIFGVKKFVRNENISSADGQATVQSIEIYKGIVTELRDQFKVERDARLAAEARYDKLLEQYAALSGEVAQLRIQVRDQGSQLEKQDTLIVSLRDEIRQLKESSYVQR